MKNIFVPVVYSQSPRSLVILDFVDTETGCVFSVIAHTTAEDPRGWYPFKFN